MKLNSRYEIYLSNVYYYRVVFYPSDQSRQQFNIGKNQLGSNSIMKAKKKNVIKCKKKEMKLLVRQIIFKGHVASLCYDVRFGITMIIV